MRISGSILLAGTMLVAGLGATTAALAGAHDMVSSDGELPRIEMSADFSTQQKSFEGTGRRRMQRGDVDDAFSEFKGNTESARRFQELLGLKEEKPKDAEADLEGLRKDIIGADNRIQVTNTTVFPNSAIVLITSSTGRCTGWMISADTVATAGHCVHSGGSGGAWKQNVVVYPGRNGAATPYGSCSAKRLYSVNGWTKSRKVDFDYGAIKLNCTVGQRTGWFGYFWTTASLNGINSTLRGFPGDKPLTMWTMDSPIAVSQTKRLFYSTDTMGGQSGSPVYYNRPNCGICSMAIHAYARGGSFPSSTYNSGTRIDQSVFNNLQSWRTAP